MSTPSSASASWGKQDVLDHLENNDGVWLLQRDDAGNLVLNIGGLTFVGTGTVSLGGNLLDVIDGRVVKFKKPS